MKKKFLQKLKLRALHLIAENLKVKGKIWTCNQFYMTAILEFYSYNTLLKSYNIIKSKV